MHLDSSLKVYASCSFINYVTHDKGSGGCKFGKVFAYHALHDRRGGEVLNRLK